MEEQTKTISIKGVEYNIEDLTEQQRNIVKHIWDLDRDVENAHYVLDRHRVSRDAFTNLLIKSTSEDSVVFKKE